MKKAANFVWIVLVIQLLFWIPHTDMAHEPGDAKSWVKLAASEDAVRDHKALPEDLFPALTEPGYRATEKHIASTLQRLGKTLILERTRGAKEVAIYRKAAPAVVFVAVGTDDKNDFNTGSGALIGDEGYIITNWHVVESKSEAIVFLKPINSTDLTEELAFLATVEKVDRATDLALLRIEDPPSALPYLRLGSISTLAVGEDVHAIGHPRGEVWTYTKGIISQIRPNYEWKNIHRATVIQTQTPLNPGNSGGPLLDDRGRIIGINSFIDLESDGLNYAVAVDEIKEFLGRRTNRRTSPRTVVSRRVPECTEDYDTRGRGRINIQGCYYRASASPPDLWLVYRTRGNQLNYVAIDSRMRGRIDTVVMNKTVEYYHYIDTDCDGTVNLVGRQRKGFQKVGTYRAPSKSLSMAAIAKELNIALEAQQIPHRNLRVCQ